MKIGLEGIYPKPKRVVMGPHPDYYPDKERCPELIMGGAYYPCSCGALACFQVFVDDGKVVDGIGSYYAYVCSTECYEQVTGKKVKWPKPVKAFDPFERKAVEEISAADAKLLQGAPEPLVVTVPVEIEEPHPELAVHPDGEELPKPKLTKEMIQKLLEKK